MRVNRQRGGNTHVEQHRRYYMEELDKSEKEYLKLHGLKELPEDEEASSGVPHPAPPVSIIRSLFFYDFIPISTRSHPAGGRSFSDFESLAMSSFF